MLKKSVCATFLSILVLVLASCTYDNSNEPAADQPDEPSREIQPVGNVFTETELGERVIISEEEARERLLAEGWTEERLDSMADINVTMFNMYNQGRFVGYIQYIYENTPIGESGEVIAPRYFGGLKFDDMGFLVVSVLPAGLDHPPTATAIDEMIARGIIIRLVQFTQESITATISRLGDAGAFEMGATSWGQGAENAVTVWLDPYTDEQKAIFNDFLIANGFDPSIFIIHPAVTQEMRDMRALSIAEATTNPTNLIVPIGKVEVSRMEIAFSLENTTSYIFSYGTPWDLARFENGAWLPMTHLPGRGNLVWPGIGFSLQGGGINHYRQSFEWTFGELPPGRYMFIRDGRLGDWNPDHARIFALVEFEVTATTPLNLTPAPEPEPRRYVEVVEVSNVTSTGMTITVENVSSYGIDHRAQIIFIVPAERATVGDRWEWWNYHLPFLSFDDNIQAEGYIPVGERRTFDIYLGNLFGELPPGDYKLDLSLGGQVGPPHPHGWAFGDALIEFTVE